MEPTLGVVAMFGGNFAPRGWALCWGQLLSIQSNTALFAILGVTYGGNGTTTFALPDLRGRTPIHPGQGPGLPSVNLGQKSGTEFTTLLTSNLPAHNHLASLNLGVATSAVTTDEPAGAIPAVGSINAYQQGVTPDGQLGGVSANTTASAGQGQPFFIRQPYLAITFIIALQGIFPSRN